MPWYGFTKHGVPDLPNIESTVLTGQIFMYPSSGARNSLDTAYVVGPPIGFLRCDGSDVLIADYQELYDYFTSTGVSFGVAANPLTHFKLPNLSGRWPVGFDAADTAFDTVGETGGGASHSHTVPDGAHTHATPTHQHYVSDHRHAYGDHDHILPLHNHGNSNLAITPMNSANPIYNFTPHDSYASDTHYHNVTGTSANAAGNVSFPRKFNAPLHATPRNFTTYVGTNDAAAANPTSILSATPTDTPGGASSSTSLGSTGTDNIPSYRSMYFIIKV